MVKYILIFIYITCIISCSTTYKLSQNLSPDAILLYNAHIINVNNGNITDNKAILIDRGLIKGIGDYADFKNIIPLSQQKNLGKKYIIPGLWDMHVHIEGEDLIEDNKALFPVYIAFGITTVRDMASDLGVQVLAWREQIKQKQLLGPEIFTAGRK